MESDKQKPIAIVGMSFRFPGDANTTEGFWDILSNARSTRTKIPSTRFDPDGFYHPNADRPGAIIAKEGCFLKEDIGLFDAPFFGITASEAEGMDPQHRMLLEVAYEAFENAGIPITKVAGTDAGCYVGGFSSDYLLFSGYDIYRQSMHQGTGCGGSMMSNRLSWFYDLRGPSFSIDTACSSSMVALHEACRDIQHGTTSMGVVAGSSLMLVPGLWRALSSQRFLSPDGTCHSFDSQANGYGRGEGVGVMILKPLADAIRDNDVIRAVIRGSGTNQDGKTPAITVPNADAQMSLIRSTYARAGLDMNQTTYFEAHGTGTPVGDPLELLAIGQTIGASRGEHDQQPILVGSVKSNIGHLEGSSGVAGVIKTILAMEHGEIPAVAEFKSLNPRINQEEWNVRIPTELTPWPADGLRRASINSFGYGGSNAHVILDDALHYLQERSLTGNHNTVVLPKTPGTPSSQSADSAISLAQLTPDTEPPAPEPKLFVFSSPEQDGLSRLAEAYAGYLGQDSLPRGLKGTTVEEIEEMANLAYTLTSRRTVFDWRSFAIADSLTGLQTSLESGLPKHGRIGKKPSCAFVFTGQGAQWFAMGRELLRHAVFRASIDEADAYIASLECTWSLKEELCRDVKTSRINDAQISQPLCTALQVALVDLLRHWGLQPKAVVGHSSGEIGAAYAAGVLSREDAWKIAYWRGLRSSQISSLAPDRKGSMLAAALSEEEAQGYLARVEKGDVVVACINSPNSVTISGDDFAVSEVEKLLAADKIWCRKLLVKTAYHSPHMQLIADQYREDIQGICRLEEPSDVTVFSSVTGSEMSREDMGVADYWVKNLVSPVQFSAAVTSLLEPRDARSRRKGAANVDAVVEIGPHSALQGPLRDILAAANESYVSSVPYTSLLQRGVSALQTAVTAAGRLWSSGFNIDLELVNSMEREPLEGRRPLVALPRYPFNHKRRYWRECRGVRWAHSHPTPRTDLLGHKASDYTTVAPIWKNFLCPSEIPWLMDHKVHGLLVMPGAVYIAMVMEACRDTADPTKILEAYEFRDILWHKPIVFESPDAHVEIFLQLSPHRIGTKTTATSSWTRFSITTVAANHEAFEHCSGLVETKYVTSPGEIEKGIEAVAEWDRHKLEYETIKTRPTISLTSRTMYDMLESNGLQFGPAFRNLFNVQSGEGFMYGEVETPDTAATMPENVEYTLPLHPTVLDASFQMLAATANGRSLDSPMLPSSIESLYVSATAPTAAGTILKGYCTRTPESRTKASGSSALSTSTWDKPVIVLKNLVITAAPGPYTGPAHKTAYARLDWMVDVNHSQLPDNLCISPSKENAAATARLGDHAAAMFIRRALEVVGGAPGAEEAAKLPVELRNYIAWMRSSLGDVVQMDDGKVHPIEAAPVVTGNSVLGAIKHIGAEISNILLNPDTKSHNVLSDASRANLTHQLLGRSLVDSVVVEILDRIGLINPNVEILEIASGTDTTVAAETLKRLAGKDSRITKYTWTSRDGDSVQTATKSLMQKPSECLDLKTLDIEGDIQAQGFVPGKLDCIILDDLLLTTSNLSTALQNIKTLLKPDGKVIVQAITKSQLRTAFVLGPFPAWWRDGDASGDRLDESAWGELLKANGFTGVDQVFRDADDPAVHQLSVMVSSAARETAYEYTDVLLVTPVSPSEEAIKLAGNCSTRLRGLGLDVGTLPWTEVVDVSGKLLISLVELDDGEVFMDLTEDLFHATKNMSLRAGGVLWVTQAGNVSGTASPGSSVSSGLFRAVRSEHETHPLASLDLSSGVDLVSAQAVDLIVRLFASLFGHGDIRASDKEFAEDDGVIYVQRVVHDSGLITAAKATTGAAPRPVTERLFQEEDRKLTMTIGQTGALDSLQFEDSDECAGPLPHDRVEVKVLYTGLNFLDVMSALGEVPKPRFGSEVVGIVTEVGSSVTHVKPGNTVVGSCTGGFGSHVWLKSTVCHQIPHTISVEEAASIPVAFMTAWIALVDLAKMRKGETVLIHSAAGGVGQAAVQISQYFGAEVFATVGSVPKKQLLMERYGIPEDRIFYSRDTTFAKGVRRMTDGRGVDVVLNSVAGEFLRQSWHLVAPFGRFVEIGKRDILGNTGLDMEPFIRNASFIGFNLAEYDDGVPQFEVVEQAQKQIFSLVAAGKLRPITPINVYDYNEIPNAFRAFQSGKMVGKIIMRADHDVMVPVVPRAEQPLALDPNATYVLAGGLGGIGRSIASMLHSHGARNLAFVSKSGDEKESAKAFLHQLRRLGCTANAYACDISDREQLSRAIEQCQSEMPPIRGSIQCAMTLKDGIFENMTYNDWVSCTRPKIQGSWNLHSVLPEDLDFFIMLASTSGVIGTPGQANYAAGNTFQDALAHYRRRQGLKAVALDIGAVRDVGYLAEANDERYWGMSHLQSLSVSAADIHFLIKSAITGYTAAGRHEMGPQIIAGLAGAKIDEQHIDRSPWARDGKLCIALKDSLTKKTAGMHAGMEALAKADTAEAAAAVVEEILIRRVAVAVMVPEDDIAVWEPLQTYGVNSLVAVEIKTWLAREFQTDISVGEISPSSISTLSKKIVTTSKLRVLRSKFKEEVSLVAS